MFEPLLQMLGLQRAEVKCQQLRDEVKYFDPSKPDKTEGREESDHHTRSAKHAADRAMSSSKGNKASAKASEATHAAATMAAKAAPHDKLAEAHRKAAAAHLDASKDNRHQGSATDSSQAHDEAADRHLQAAHAISKGKKD